ncbi:MAG: formylglycine-generating enzyme family protein [Nitrospira sp.]|nr:formylglycine-generating enzyme family protein [Nitrospira sp.]
MTSRRLLLAALLLGLSACHQSLVQSTAEQDSMALIPAGEFLMGSPEGSDSFSDERPQRTVVLSAFWMDRYEVTNIQYEQFVTATGHRPPENTNPTVTLWERGYPLADSERHPVVNVSWHDAVAYCRWAGKRLPTEAEWEKAARGTDGRLYPWGNEWDFKRANSASYWAERTIEFKDGSAWKAFWVAGEGARISKERGLKGEVLTMPVGSFPDGASPYGILDMAGNASEWVQDWFEPYYYLKAPQTDPRGPAGILLKVVRGGSWLKPAKSLRTADRDYGYPDDRPSGTGFRCAKDIR